MAERIYLCGRGGETDVYTEADLERVAARICPDNAPFEPEVTREDGILYCLINPPECLPVRERSVCLGRMIPPRDDWHRPDTPRPDGCYGIVRANAETVEVLSDFTPPGRSSTRCYRTSSSQRPHSGQLCTL